MSRVITFSRVFPSYHPRKGEPTYFVEKIFKSLNLPRFDSNGVRVLKHEIFNFADFGRCEPKHHTIRAGHRWKVGDKFSPRVWSGKPYNSKMITIAPDIQVKKIWGFEIKDSIIRIRGSEQSACGLWDVPADEIPFVAKNDGLSFLDFMHWFRFPKDFTGQIICWNETIEY